MIFDRFEDRQTAEGFAEHAKSRFGRKATVHGSQAESDRIDPFPFELQPPIVLVERAGDFSLEDEIEESVNGFGGEFAGT